LITRSKYLQRNNALQKFFVDTRAPKTLFFIPEGPKGGVKGEP